MTDTLFSLPAVLGDGSKSPDMGELFLAGALLFGGMLLFGLVIVFAKKKYHESKQGDGSSGPGLDIDRLEAMRVQLTEEEFSLLRKRALGLDSGYDKKCPSTSSDPDVEDDESTE